MNKLLQNGIITICLSMTTVGGLQAQKLQASRHHFSTEDGLTSNAITQIVQDPF